MDLFLKVLLVFEVVKISSRSEIALLLYHLINSGSKNCELDRVSVQGIKSLGGHFACLCRGFEFYEVNCYYFSKRKWKYFYTFNHFYSEKSSKRANSTNLLL